jgi:hypothetical protein
MHNPFVEAVKQGGDVALSVVGITAVTFPVVQTFLSVKSLESAVKAQGEVLKAQGEVLATIVRSLEEIEKAVQH